MDIRPRIWPRSLNNTILSLYLSGREYRTFVWEVEVYESIKGGIRVRRVFLVPVGSESCRVCLTICLYSSLFLLHLSGYHEGGGCEGGEASLDPTEGLGEDEGCG